MSLADSLSELLGAIRPYVIGWIRKYDGWMYRSETWTYASATTITASGDFRADIFKGDVLKLTQTTVKYFYIVGVAYSLGVTTFTVTGGSDYTVANAAITDVFISHVANPPGFPGWFNWAPTLTGFSADPTNSIYRFSIQGRVVTCAVRQGTAGTSNATTFRISLPVYALSTTNYGWYGAIGFVVDNGTLSTDGSFAITAAANTYIVVNRANNAAWTASGDKRASGGISYEI